MKTKPINILYTNHRGETNIRTILPKELKLITNEWHDKEWCIVAFDQERQAERTFALKNIKAYF